MAKQRSKKDRKIFSVTGSTGAAEPGWSELTRERSSGPALEHGVPDEAARDLWEPKEVDEPVAPEIER